MKTKDISPLYRQIIHLLPPLTYVDVGARAVKHNRFVKEFPQAFYIGFEPDIEECKRLNALNIEKHQFYPQALGRKSETRTLYVTRNPACSSLYEPNSKEMYRFIECGPYFDVLKKKAIETVSLDEWYRDAGIPEVAFLELDTQGSELDILRGSKHLLTASIMGLQVEVEFFPIYKNQPLFSDVDSYLQRLGFSLFDLSRYRLRRAFIKTRGQLLWGHALYLKDLHEMKERQLAQILNLSAIASFYGFEDYALEVLETTLKDAFDLEPSDTLEKIEKVLASHSQQFSMHSRRGLIKRLRKAPSPWKVAPRKDRGYFIKD
jgi:FkbM family methyltransferase